MIIGVFLLIGIVVTMSAIVVTIGKSNFSDNNDIILFIACTVSFFLFLMTGLLYSKEIPAIEVYRGNTTLEITYKDSIPVDTTVVYKTK